MEENVLNGGMGLTVSDYMNEHYPEIKIMHVAIPDGYVEHGDVSKLRRELGIDSDSILDRLRDRL